MKTIAIIGAGTGGTTMANRLARRLDADWRIVLCDRDDLHVYQPGLLFVPFGMYREDELYRPRTSLLDARVELRLGGIDAIEPDARRVRFEGGESLAYDLLILATGTEVNPQLTPGLEGPGWYESAFDFYTPAGARALAERLERFEGGRLVVHIAELPIKCPVAPLEFTFLADAWLTERGLRDKVELIYATPLDAAFTKPRAAAALGHLLDERGVALQADVAVERVDGSARVLHTFDGREIDYDLLVTVPVHTGSPLIQRSGLGDAMGFVPTDRHTLAVTGHEGVFALGDCTDLPTSKAGSVAHFQSEVLTENVLRTVAGRPLLPEFDGHANCFIETGYGKAMLIDFNYTTEPLPGRFPLPGLGPFTLLGETAANHWGKLAFKWIYWNMLVRGEDLPIEHRMSMLGKRGGPSPVEVTA